MRRLNVFDEVIRPKSTKTVMANVIESVSNLPSTWCGLKMSRSDPIDLPPDDQEVK